MQVVGEFEYYLASAFDEIYIPPSAYISLRGLAVQGAFLGGESLGPGHEARGHSAGIAEEVQPTLEKQEGDIWQAAVLHKVMADGFRFHSCDREMCCAVWYSARGICPCWAGCLL